MKITRSASGKNRLKMTHNEWRSMGKKAGWISVAGIDEDLQGEQGQGQEQEQKQVEDVQEEYLTFSYGMTPEDIIKEKVTLHAPNGYPMHLKSQDDWSMIAKVVNQGIDAHLEGFTRSTFDNSTGKCLIHSEEMTTFLRRLLELEDPEADDFRTSILTTLDIEEV